jgi:hypothetical protein
MTCDPTEIDEDQCAAEGITKQAAVIAEDKPALDARRTKFSTARSEYTQARAEAAKTVKDVRYKLEHVLDQLSCKLTDDEKSCLDDAFAEVVACIEDCDPPPGCCVDDECDFDTDFSDVPPEELMAAIEARIAEIRRRVEAVEKCFDEVLIAEPEALKQRAADRKTEIEDLIEDLGADPKKDESELYARALKAQRDLDEVWGGFEDANHFQDCLCEGLKCSARGRRVIAELSGELQRLTCLEGKATARCEWLKEHIVEETVAVCRRHWPSQEECEEELVEPAAE